MASVINMETVASGYKGLCELILTFGEETSPRGQLTREILNPTIILQDPACALPLGIGRSCRPDIGAVEAVQLCGAFSNPDLTALLSPYYASLREPHTDRYHGAYGVRISNQLHYARNKLESDRDSRQAVITLWDPGLDNLAGKKDYPCTVSFQFYIREDMLWLSTNMRSNDAWLGLAYDLFQFGQLQWTLANMLNIGAGPLIHRPVSLHLYERDWEKVDLLSEPPATPKPLRLHGFRSSSRAATIGRRLPLEDLTWSEKWYVERLEPLFEKLAEDAS